jgi:hypothetical protein
MTYRDALADLAAALPTLKGTRQYEFAISLLAQATERSELGSGALSPNQWQWVRKLAAQPALPAQSTAPADLTPIQQLFAKAAGPKATQLNRSALLFATDDGTQYRLSVAGNASQNPGSINVTDNGPGGFGGRVWFGRIALDGRFVPSRRVAAELTTAVVAALAAFAANPQAQAARFGRDTGVCCFCARELTDPRSIEVGYGPICADRWGLPHRANGEGA